MMIMLSIVCLYFFEDTYSDTMDESESVGFKEIEQTNTTFHVYYPCEQSKGERVRLRYFRS